MEVQIFENHEFGKVRTVMINNEPYFVGNDIAEILGYENPSAAISKKVDEEDKGISKMETPGGLQNVSVINESGLYSLILSSKLPSAKKFKHWVTSVVLPTIRKTGSYSLPTTYKEALQKLLIEVEKNERLALENKEMQPKAEFYDAVTGSSDCIEMKEVAKLLNIKDVGRNKLFEILRNKKVLDRNNQPYQKFVDAGLFRVVESKYCVNGDVRIKLKTVVFQKGIDFIKKVVEENNF